MNELILKEMDLHHITYLYIPNGKGEPGEIVYSFDNKETSYIKAAEDDTGYFARKAAKKISEIVKENNLPIKFIQAWY
jgi:hypothetical protein